MVRLNNALQVLFSLCSLLVLIGCDSTQPQSGVSGISEKATIVDSSSVLVELRVTTDHGNFESTVTHETLVQVGDEFGYGDENIFSVAEITSGESVAIEMLANSQQYNISDELSTDGIVGESGEQFQLRVLKKRPIDKVTSDKKADVQRIKKVAARVTLDAMGSVQEIIFNPGNAKNEYMNLVSRFKNLRTLVATNADISHQGLNSLKKLSRLRELDLSGGYISEREINSIANFESLEALVLNDVTVSHRDIQAVTKIKQLRLLSLKGASVSTSVFWSLQRNMPECVVVGESKLRWGVLRTAKGEKSVVDLAGDAEYEYESAARANALLMGVNLVENEAGEVIAADASRHTEHSPTQAANAIYALRAFFQLKRVDLSYSDCGGGGLVELKHLGTNGLNNDLEPILLEELSLAGVEAPSDSWFELNYQYRLKRLDLSHSNITDEGVKRLRVLKRLETLNLNGVNVAANTIEYLATQLPNTKIIH